MLYLAFALNTLVLAVLAFELYGSRKERRDLSLLIKSRDVQEFVRAEQQLSKPPEPEEPVKDRVVDLEQADPNKVAEALEHGGNA